MKKIIFTFFIMCSFFFSTSVFAKDFSIENDKVYVSGETIGLKLNTGVLVTKLYSVQVGEEYIKPWEDSDLMIGDIILKVNDINIVNSDGLIGALKVNSNTSCCLQILRDDKIISTYIKPVSYDNTVSLGIYVKDNILGVGTMTFITQDDLSYASLGHHIATKISTDSGYIYKAEVVGIDKSSKGNPGSKKASIDTKEIGNINLNSNKGIYGNYTGDTSSLNLYSVMSKTEVKKGAATILTCINGKDVVEYDIMITNVSVSTTDNIKGIKFKIVDESLLNATGGVIQGMSGSPIIQNGKLAGAVTHVIVNTPEYGYGVFAQNMLMELDYKIVE